MDTLFQPFKVGFSLIGLNTPTQRFFAFGALGGLGEYYLKPGYSYKGDGSARPWALYSTSSDSTYLPVGSTALLAATAFSLFF